MSVQRINIDVWESPIGQYVTYADHVAALAEAEQRVQREGWQAGFDYAWPRGMQAQRDEVTYAETDDAYEQGQRDERERHANELDVAVAKARAEVVTVNLEGDFNYVKGYNDGLVKGYNDGLVKGYNDGRREGYRIGYDTAWSLSAAEIERQTLREAREAVAAFEDYPGEMFIDKERLLAAIDALAARQAPE
jgi:flagellar biosynthesis/type III secretory pathway protein FliH